MPALDIQQLRDRYEAKAKELHAIVKKAEEEDRGLTEEDKQKYDLLAAECRDLQARIKVQDDLLHEFHLRHANDAANEDRLRDARDESRKAYDGGDPNAPLNSSQRSRAMTTWLMHGCAKFRGSEVDYQLVKRSGLDISCTEQFFQFDRGCSASGMRFGVPRTRAEALEQHKARMEQRATNIVGTTTLGGFIVPNEAMYPLDIALLEFGGMREAATVVNTATGATMQMPTINDTAIEGIEVPEDTLHPDQEMTFAQVTLGAYKYGSRIIPVSVEFLQDAFTDPAALIFRLIGERLGRITNRRFTTGTGTLQPRGITIDSTASGVTAGTANVITFAEMNTLVHSVDPAYRMGARFMMHDSILGRVQAMVDSQGRPLYLPNLVAGVPGTFMGYSVVVNQHMPTAAAGKGIEFGQLEKYIIRDTAGITLVRLNERYAEFGRVAFFGWMRTDGRLLDAGTHPVKHLILL